jgi:hypothetical protein
VVSEEIEAKRYPTDEGTLSPQWLLGEGPLTTQLSRSRLLLRAAGVGQGPTKSPIVCLASDSRHWGLKISASSGPR